MPPRPQFTECEVRMILSAVCFFKLEGEKLGDKRYRVYQRVSECLGISLRSVKNVTAKDKENTSEESPSPPVKKRRSTGRPKIQVDQFTIGVIRRSIHEFFCLKCSQQLRRSRRNLKKPCRTFPLCRRQRFAC